MFFPITILLAVVVKNVCILSVYAVERIDQIIPSAPPVLRYPTLNISLVNNGDERLVPLTISEGSTRQPDRHLLRNNILSITATREGSCSFSSSPGEFKLNIFWKIEDGKWIIDANVDHEYNKKMRECAIISPATDLNKFKVIFDDGLPSLCKTLESFSSTCYSLRPVSELTFCALSIIGNKEMAVLSARSMDLFKIGGAAFGFLSGVTDLIISSGEYGKPKAVSGFLQTLFATIGWNEREKIFYGLQSSSVITTQNEVENPCGKSGSMSTAADICDIFHEPLKVCCSSLEQGKNMVETSEAVIPYVIRGILSVGVRRYIIQNAEKIHKKAEKLIDGATNKAESYIKDLMERMEDPSGTTTLLIENAIS